MSSIYLAEHGINDRFINEANLYQNGDENREYAVKTTYFTLIF